MGASKELRNFVAVLIDHHRIGHIDEVSRLFKQELNQRLGIAETQVSSARELSKEEKQALEKQMQAITGQTVRATYTRDEKLLGGVVVRIGSTIYDGSVRGQLQKIREQIAGS
jgi:F-type H+-transporting ATPase subunit delta